MATITVAKKWKSCMFVTSAYKVHRETLLDGIAELARRPVPDEDPAEPGTPDGGKTPDGQETPALTVGPSPRSTFFFTPASTTVEEARKMTAGFLDHVVDTMEHRALAMVWSDMVNLDELDEGTARRFGRARLVSELSRQYVRQRDALINLFDERTAWSFGFERNVEREPSRLTLQVRRAATGLTSGKVALDETFDGAVIDFVRYGRVLEAKLEELEKALVGINYEVRETEGTIQAKKATIQAHDDVFVPGSRCLEAAFMLAGMPDLAKKVKPSVRRPGRRSEEAEAEREGQPEPPGFEVLGVEEPSMPTLEDPVIDS